MGHREPLPTMNHLIPKDRKEIKPLRDGIGVGTIREAGYNVEPSRWCAVFGHKWRKFGDGEACTVCWIDREVYAPSL